MQALPPAFRDRTDQDDVQDDVAGSRELTPAQRGEILESLCALAAEQTAQHASPDAVLRWQEPLPESSEAILARLRRAYRRTHG